MTEDQISNLNKKFWEIASEIVARQKVCIEKPKSYLLKIDRKDVEETWFRYLEDEIKPILGIKIDE